MSDALNHFESHKKIKTLVRSGISRDLS